MEFYDCFRLNSFDYCRRPETPIDLQRDKDRSLCEQYGGVLHSFEDLRANQTDISTILHEWKSSLESVERYARFLRTTSQQNDEYLCQCLNRFAFGKHCEYQLPYGSTLDETLAWQIQMKMNYPEEGHFISGIVCYQGLQCDSGLLCLDWREVCDGVQNCLSAVDENHCDRLDMNRCNDDEYRCMNGMCIPDQYFLDGEFDCLDWSDELQYTDSKSCAIEAASSECDDHMCPKQQWSCGDGQCIPDRLAFQRLPELPSCYDRRDQFYMCETNPFVVMRMLKNGRCYPDGIDEEQLPIESQTIEDRCEFLLKCTLSHDGHIHCEYDDESSYAALLNASCPLSLIAYPRRPLIHPYLTLLYQRSRHSHGKRATFASINGTIQCGNSLVNVQETIRLQRETNLWDMIKTRFCNQTQQVSTHVTSNHHCFRCSAGKSKCLNIMSLGNGKIECSNRYDELWLGTDRKISSLKCNEQSRDECALLRQYIENSWNSVGSLRNTLPKNGIPFCAFCDTFWDFDSTEDENIGQCQQSWVCAADQWRCQTGQCIDSEWTEDYGWDSNASDQQMTCIDHNRIGDNHIDCLGAIDERNRMRHCSQSSMLGNHFRCASDNTCIPYLYHCQENFRCPNRIDDERWCDRSTHASNCSADSDFICFDGLCLENDRCNLVPQCSMGEDEYMCDYLSVVERTLVPYREEEERTVRIKSNPLRLSQFPQTVNVTYLNERLSQTSDIKIYVNSLPMTFLTSQWCQRGLGILLGNDAIACFCPPQYYGEHCQYQSDRLVLLIHLNLTESIYNAEHDANLLLRLLVLFVSNDEILMTHEFHLRLSSHEKLTTKKFKTHLLYSYSNRSRQHPYSVRIEAYQLNRTKLPSVVAVWQYPIDLNFLPVYGLSKILHLSKIDQNLNPCSFNVCQTDEQCHPLMNNHSHYICLKNNCDDHYCAPESLCRPKSRGLLRGHSSSIYCICPAHRYGDRCDLEYDNCRSNPCLHGSSCLSTDQPNQVICLCTIGYYGPLCQWTKSLIDLTLDDDRTIAGLVLQFFDINLITLDLILVRQNVSNHLPSSIQYQHDQRTVPEIILAKIYSTFDQRDPDFYLLSVQINATKITGTTVLSETNRCQSIHLDVSPIRYHQICRNDSRLLCFHDDVYLYICANNHSN